jgi:hypothetical protein
MAFGLKIETGRLAVDEPPHVRCLRAMVVHKEACL